jgi:hypothetical protein
MYGIEMTAERLISPALHVRTPLPGLLLALPRTSRVPACRVPSWRPHGGGGDRTRAVGAGVWVRQ